MVNPALVIRHWGLSPARVEIDGQPVPAGKDLRLGSVHRLEGDDLVVWVREEATAPLRITVAPAGVMDIASSSRTPDSPGRTITGSFVKHMPAAIAVLLPRTR